MKNLKIFPKMFIQIFAVIDIFYQAPSSRRDQNIPYTAIRYCCIIYCDNLCRCTGAWYDTEIFCWIRFGSQNISVINFDNIPMNAVSQRIRFPGNYAQTQTWWIPQIISMVFIVQIICSVRDGLRPAGAVIHCQGGLIRRAVIRWEGLFDVRTAVLHTRRRLEQQPLGLRIIAGLPALDRVGDIKSISMCGRLRRAAAVRNGLWGQQIRVAVRIHVRPVRRRLASRI